MKQVLAISLLILLLAVPVFADMDESFRISDPKSWFATEHDVNALAGRVEAVQNTLSERVAMLETTLTERLARMESTLNDRLAALKGEISDLRANAQSRANGESKDLTKKTSLREGGVSNGNLNALTQRAAEIEKSLTEMVAKIREVRGQLQDLGARAELKGRQAS